MLSHITVWKCSLKSYALHQNWLRQQVALGEKIRGAQNEKSQRGHQEKVKTMKSVPSLSEPDHGPTLTPLVLTCKGTPGKWTYVLYGVFPSPFIHFPIPQHLTNQGIIHSFSLRTLIPYACKMARSALSQSPEERALFMGRTIPQGWQLFCIWTLIHNQALMNHAILLKSTVLKSTT